MNYYVIIIAFFLFVLYRYLAPVLKGQLSYKSLKELMEGAAPPLILDVRTPSEYRTGHLPGAKNVPHTTLPGGLKKKFAAGEKTIVVYCQSGARASAALRALKHAGYTDVRNFGSVRRWKDSLTS